jgi:hypothetical protein
MERLAGSEGMGNLDVIGSSLVNGTALRSPIYIDARDIAVTKIVPESNVFISLRIASSEKQIPRFVGNVSG